MSLLLHAVDPRDDDREIDAPQGNTPNNNAPLDQEQAVDNNNDTPADRQTKISFEVHPHLILLNLMGGGALNA